MLLHHLMIHFGFECHFTPCAELNGVMIQDGFHVWQKKFVLLKEAISAFIYKFCLEPNWSFVLYEKPILGDHPKAHSEKHCGFHENCHFSWKPQCFSWKVVVFMKSGSFY